MKLLAQRTELGGPAGARRAGLGPVEAAAAGLDSPVVMAPVTLRWYVQAERLGGPVSWHPELVGGVVRQREVGGAVCFTA